MTENKGTEQRTIMGIVVPHDWDDDGKVTAVAISTQLEDEYVVRGGAVREQLMRLLGSKVVATGIITTDSDWNKAITVETYEVLGYDEEEFDHLEDYEEEEDFENQEEFEYQEEW